MKCSLSVRSLLAVSLVLAGCSKQGAQEGDIAEVAPESVPVLAMFELPSGRSLGSAAQVIDAVQPGASAQAAASISTMLTSLAEIPSLNGADLDKPVRAVVLDPKKHPKPVLLLVSVSKADELATAVGKERLIVRKDLGLIGAPEAAKAAHDYAFGTLARRETPAAPYGVAYVQPILASFRAEIDAGKAQIGSLMAMAGGNSEMMTKLLTVYIDSVVAITEQTERVEVRFASQDAVSGVELILHARPDTTLAGFNKAQAPSDLALIEMLPAHESPLMVMAGGLVLGPARQAFMDIGEGVLATMLGGGANPELRGWMGPFMDLFTGRFAAVITAMGLTPQMAQLYETTDSAQAASHSRKLMESFAASGKPLEMGGMKQTITFTSEAFTHDGVSVMLQQTKTELPAAEGQEQPAESFESKSYFAPVDKFLGMAVGEEQAMRQLIDAVRDKGPRLQVGGGLGTAVAATKARKDSLLMYMNLAGLSPVAEGMPQAVVMTLGFDDTRMRAFFGAGR